MDVSTVNGKLVVVEMELVMDADGVLKALDESLLEVTGRLDVGFFDGVVTFVADNVFLVALGDWVIRSVESFCMLIVDGLSELDGFATVVDFVGFEIKVVFCFEFGILLFGDNAFFIGCSGFVVDVCLIFCVKVLGLSGVVVLADDGFSFCFIILLTVVFDGIGVVFTTDKVLGVLFLIGFLFTV